MEHPDDCYCTSCLAQAVAEDYVTITDAMDRADAAAED